MGFIDPMAINSAAATGAIDFGGGAALWLLAMGVLIGSFGSLVFAGTGTWPLWRRAAPRHGLAPAGAALAGRVR